MNHAAPIRTRFAPSPTGDPHLGNIRTALFQALFAASQNGTFILRVEDTDQTREVEGSVEHMLEGLAWLSITPDEGVMLTADGALTEKGDFGPYHQTARRELYDQYAAQLIKEGKAYYCFASKEELDEMRAKQQEQHLPPRYDGRYRDLDPAEAAKRVEAGESHVIRFKMPLEGTVTGHDLVFGDITFDYAQFDDHIIIKADGLPTYHFAGVVDDHLMQISHVFRGEEWISSWPRHLATYAAFNWDLPEFVHLSLIFGSDHSKLSKRHGAQTVLAYRDQGYLPEAIVNVLAFLGWNPKTTDEFFYWDDLVAAFDIKGINKANPIFDPVKLDHVNGHFLRELTNEGLLERALPWLEAAEVPLTDTPMVLAALATVKERAKTLAELPELMKFYFSTPAPDPELIRFKKQESAETARLLEWAITGAQALKEWNYETVETEWRARIEEAGVGAGEMLWPVRAALTGEKASPGAFEVAVVLGQDETVKRLQAAVDALKA